MPSPKKKQPAHKSHPAFIPFIVLALVLWFLYRALFNFPVWFDETIGKAIFFGLPVWVYVSTVNTRSVVETFSFDRMKSGLLRGVAVGGLFGFMASLLAVWQAGGASTAAVFSSDYFWWEFMLALFTGFWETLFFFSWIMIILQEKWPKWSLFKQVLAVAAIFLVFHLPNTILRFSAEAILYQVVLLSLFAIGQALIFSNWKNGYALTLSHAIWGMVLLVHFS